MIKSSVVDVRTMSSNSKLLPCGGNNKRCPKPYFCTGSGRCAPCSKLCTNFGQPNPSPLCTAECPNFINDTYGNSTLPPATPTTISPTTYITNTSNVKRSHSSHLELDSHQQSTHNVSLTLSLLSTVTSVIAILSIIGIIIALFVLLRRRKQHNRNKHNIVKDFESGEQESQGLLESQPQVGPKLDDIDIDIEDIKIDQVHGASGLNLNKNSNVAKISSLSNAESSANEFGVNWRDPKRSEKVHMKKQGAVPIDSIDSTATESSVIVHEQVVREPPEHNQKLDGIPIRSGTESDVHNEQNSIPVQSSQISQPPHNRYTIPDDASLMSNSLTEDDAYMPVQCSSCGESHEPDRFVNNASVRNPSACTRSVNHVVRNKQSCEKVAVENADNSHLNGPTDNTQQCACKCGISDERQPDSSPNCPMNSLPKVDVDNMKQHSHNNIIQSGSNDHIQQCTSKRGISDECNPDSQPTHALNSLRKVDVADMNTHSCNNVLHEGPTDNTQQCACKCGISDERQPDSSPNRPMNSFPKVDVEDMKQHSHNNIIQSGADSNNPICNGGIVDEQRADSYPTKALNSLPTVDINEMETHGTNNIADTGSSHDSVTPYPLPDEGSVPSEIAPTPNNTSRSNTPQPHSNNS